MGQGVGGRNWQQRKESFPGGDVVPPPDAPIRLCRGRFTPTLRGFRRNNVSQWGNAVRRTGVSSESLSCYGRGGTPWHRAELDGSVVVNFGYDYSTLPGRPMAAPSPASGPMLPR